MESLGTPYGWVPLKGGARKDSLSRVVSAPTVDTLILPRSSTL